VFQKFSGLSNRKKKKPKKTQQKKKKNASKLAQGTVSRGKNFVNLKMWGRNFSHSKKQWVQDMLWGSEKPQNID